MTGKQRLKVLANYLTSEVVERHWTKTHVKDANAS